MLVSLVSACDTTKEQIQGVWSSHIWPSYYSPSYYFERIEIKNDSIIFLSEDDDEFRTTFVLQDDFLISDGVSFRIKLHNDSVLSFDSVLYVNKYHSAFVYQHRKLLVNLPEVVEVSKIEESNGSFVINIPYGKQIGTDKYSFLLNEWYGDFNDLLSWSDIPYPKNSLACFSIDKDLKMKSVDSLFHGFRMMGFCQLYLLTDSKTFKYKTGIKYFLRNYTRKEYELKSHIFTGFAPFPQLFMNDSVLSQTNSIIFELDSVGDLSVNGKIIEPENVEGGLLDVIKSNPVAF